MTVWEEVGILHSPLYTLHLVTQNPPPVEAFAIRPANAVENHWWRGRGAHVDGLTIPAEGWNFRTPSGFLESLLVYSYGEIQPDVETTYFPRPFPEADLSLLPEGYYATANYTDSLSHTKKAGAGWTRRVSPGNYWTVDMAGTFSSYENWSTGRMEWKIPIGWFRFFEGKPVESRIEVPEYEKCGNTNSRQLFISNPDTYRQTFTIDGNGTFKIEKHGHWLSRSTNCVITLDGRVIQERHP